MGFIHSEKALHRVSRDVKGVVFGGLSQTHSPIRTRNLKKKNMVRDIQISLKSKANEGPWSLRDQ